MYSSFLVITIRTCISWCWKQLVTFARHLSFSSFAQSEPRSGILVLDLGDATLIARRANVGSSSSSRCDSNGVFGVSLSQHVALGAIVSLNQKDSKPPTP